MQSSQVQPSPSVDPVDSSQRLTDCLTIQHSTLLIFLSLPLRFFLSISFLDGQLWKEVKQEVDYLLKPQVLADAERHVRSANLSRIVLIDNLQQAIEVENPPAEEIAQLQNRKGKWFSFFFSIFSYFYHSSYRYTENIVNVTKKRTAMINRL